MEFNVNLINHIEGNNIIVPQIPKKYVITGVKPLKDLIFTTPEKYMKYLQDQKAFWEKQQAKYPHFSVYTNAYLNSINHLSSANSNAASASARDIFSPNLSNAQNFLTRSINFIADVPNNATILSKELIRHGQMGQRFFTGFLSGITNTDSAPYNNSTLTKDFIQGLFAATVYLDIIKSIDAMLPDGVDTIGNAQADLMNTANEYITKYNKLLEQKENKITKMDSTVEKRLKEHEENLRNLERTYEEKIRLREPAKHWSAVSDDYAKKGRNFVYLSIAASFLSICIIVGLIILLAYLPEIREDVGVFDYFQISAGFAIVTAIAVYILRIFVKMAMSSYHLSRDAKERENLTTFYLSLTNEKPISEKERDLIITSLFSRANTGLIKGDDAPEFPIKSPIS
ncbi:MAG: DUF6161 domain-containing protein [Firmicutes bacterium]|nr:DUF6161 domain-containing protein [Bacillota bacterium]